MSRLAAVVGSVGVGAFSVAAVWVLLRRRVAKLEDTTKAQRKALTSLVQKVNALEEEVRAVSQQRPAALGVPVGGSSAPQSAAREQLSWENQSSRSAATTIDEINYQTADEEIEGYEDDNKVVATRRGADHSPVRVDDWAARSVCGDATWSCVDGGVRDGTAASGSASKSGVGAAAAAVAAEAEARAAAEAAILQRVDAMYDAQEFEAANELLAGSEQSVEVLWRRCRILKELSDVAKRNGQPKQCEAMLKEGLGYVSTALQRDETHFAVHKWYAIAVSSTSAYEGTRATIETSFVVREHFARACELNPLDATSRHLLGIWYYEVAGLSWAMRKLAATLFAAPPTGTYDEALAHFQLAEGIKPGFYVRNRLMLAKCQKELRDKPAARKWATLALELPTASHDDTTANAEAKALLAAL